MQGKVPEFLEASFYPSVLWALSSKEGKVLCRKVLNESKVLTGLSNSFPVANMGGWRVQGGGVGAGRVSRG